MAAIERLANLHGTPDKPLVFDYGDAVFDGHSKRCPLEIVNCSHLSVRGGLWRNSHKTVVWVRDSSNIDLREMLAHDAADENVNVFGVHHAHHVRLMDCAGWGIARKVISFSQGGDDCAAIRCWARFDGSTAQGWKMTYAPAYNNYRVALLDCIGVCNRVPDTPHDWRGIFGADRMDSGDRADSLIHRCLAMSPHKVTAFQQWPVDGLAFVRCMDATSGKMPDTSLICELAAVWAQSPIRARMRASMDVDPLTELLRIVGQTIAPPLPLSGQAR